MNSEDSRWIWVIGIIATTILLFSLGMYAINTYKVVKMASYGYEEIAYPGSVTTYYHKVR